MKIYHIALLSKNEPNRAPSRAMVQRGHDVMELDWVETVRRGGVGFLRATIIEDVRTFKPDLIFMQIQTDGIIDMETASIISRDSFVVNWTGDVRANIDWYKALAPFIDITLFSNMTDVRNMWADGLRSDYLQVGYDCDLYTDGRSMKTFYPMITFLGNNYSSSPIKFPLSKERVDMVNYMKTRFKGKFKVYGSGWAGSQRLQINDEINCYRFSKIAINQNHFDYEKFSSDRIFRAMGCGIFMASKYYKGIEDEFEMGKHLECWSTLQELEDICKYYIEHDTERKKIAKAGMLHVRENHRWHNRIDELVLIKEKYSKEITT